MDFTFTAEDLDTCRLFRIYGNLSLSACLQLERELRETTRKQSVIIDLADAGIITTSGMNLLVNAGLEARQNGKRVIIMKPTEEFREMMDRLHNYEYFIIVSSVEEGKTRIKYYT